jgi:uncharacterized FlgJ-related protein
MKNNFIFLFVSTILFSGPVFAANQEEAEIVVERTIVSRSYHDVIRLFDKIGYTTERWQAGIREIPRIQVSNIPDRWQKVSSTIPVKEKKSIFFRLIGSGVLQANEKILATRESLLAEMAGPKVKQSDWLHQLAIKYKVIKAVDNNGDDNSSDGKKSKDINLAQAELDELLLRVDTVPPSLALAQGAIESGWGSSRFAVQGNSLFGMWDFSGKGIKPKKQRSALGNYGVAAYDSPQASIDAYMLNLNTHNAYRKLRAKRAELRKQKKKHTGYELAKTLDSYSERGGAYIKELHNIMRHNKLTAADDAYLWDKGVIVITPAP